MNFKITTVFAILALLTPIPAQASTLFPDLKTAKSAYSQKDYVTAAANWLPLAHKGNATAQLELGKLYLKGLGVEQNNQKAFEYLRMAANQDNARAMFEIGRLHEKGIALPKNSSKAKEWYLKAADNGYARGFYNTALLYERKKLGATAEEQEKQSTIYHQKAKENGYVPASKKSFELKSLQIKSANKKKPYKIITELKTQFAGESNIDLGTQNNETETAVIFNGKIGAYLYPSDNITTYIEARGLHSDGIATSNNDEDDDTANISFVEMRQAWVQVKNIFGVPPLSIKTGRQRFYEPRGLWWNRDLDAVKLDLDSTLTSGFIALGENQAKYRIGNDDDLERDEEKRLRFLGEISHEYTQNQEIGFRFLYEEDHSGVATIGQSIPANDRDDEDNKLLWLGLHSNGQLPTLPNTNIRNISYRADLMSVSGEATNITTSPGADASLRTVSATNNRNVLGWGFDGTLHIALENTLQPTLNFGYAYGSGDDGNGSGNSNDSAFRQTGLQGNTSLFPRGKTTGALRNYGEVLRPELSNLHILSTGVNFPILQASDVNLNYFSYWLDEAQVSSLRSSGISANLNGTDEYIGQALDFSANINIGKELKVEHYLLKNAALRIRLGGFQSGDAYGTAKNEKSYRGSTELRIKF